MGFFVRKKKNNTNAKEDIVLEHPRIVCSKKAVEEIEYFLDKHGIGSVEGFIKNIEAKIIRGSATIEASEEEGKIIWIHKDSKVPIVLLKEEYAYTVEQGNETIQFSAYDHSARERRRKDEKHDLITYMSYCRFFKSLTQGKKSFCISISGNGAEEKLEAVRCDIDDYLMSLDLDELPNVQDIAEKLLELLNINWQEGKFDIEYGLSFSGFTARTIIQDGLWKQLGLMDDKKQIYNLYYNRSWDFLKPGYEISLNALAETVTYITGKENLNFSPAQEFEKVQKKVDELFAMLL